MQRPQRGPTAWRGSLVGIALVVVLAGAVSAVFLLISALLVALVA